MSKIKELIANSEQEIIDREIAKILGITYEQISDTIYEVEQDEFQTFDKIIFDIESSSAKVLSKINGLQDGYWIIVDSITVPVGISQIY